MALIPADFRGAHSPLQISDLIAEAATLQCTQAIVHAFSDIESTGSGFLPGGELKMLYEARYFHLLTKGEFDRLAPNLSSPVWDRSLYGAGGLHQLARLKQAMRLSSDPAVIDAALKSCSIGRYQVIGANHKMLGYPTVSDMYVDFCASELPHLKGFGSFIKSAGLLDELQSDPPEFVALAVGYNGAGERANGYAQKLQTECYHYVAEGEGIIPQRSGGTGRADDP